MFHKCKNIVNNVDVNAVLSQQETGHIAVCLSANAMISPVSPSSSLLHKLTFAAQPSLSLSLLMKVQRQLC